ncbi:hypothetical protein [Streptomyces odonnellii]|uniref:hypothetical protein n=1 Tax=Streptomyces odonnellii TaxID=1417980 RepID=UPI0006259752|nr:hypothetical protein [Streptomyces odonnellii]
MSAYTSIYQALTKRRTPMPPSEAARLLSELRAETGADLAAGLRDHAAIEFQPGATDTRAIHRRKKAKYGAVIACADWVLKATGARPMPTQRTRSTS